MAEQIRDFYEKGVNDSQLNILRFEKLVNIYSFLRLFLILLGIFAVYQSLQFEKIWLTELTVLFLVISFAYLVKKQGSFEKQKEFYQALKAVNVNEIESIVNQSNIYSDGMGYISDAHNYSSDLDIFGKASLFNLVNRCASPMGNDKLASWLRQAVERPQILERQESVQEISTKRDWVQDLKAFLLFAKDSEPAEIKNLLSFFQSFHEDSSRALRIYLNIVPFLVIVSAGLAWFVPLLAVPLGMLILTNAILVLSNQIRINKIDRMTSRVGKTLAAYSQAFKSIENEEWTSDLSRTLSNGIKDIDESTFSSQLKKLSVLTSRFEYRLNMFVGPLLNGLMAWDVRQIVAIDDWKKQNKELMPRAFDVLASFESLVSLSSLHTNYPNWTFPQISPESNYTYLAEELAHPLIPVNARVSNNFSLLDTHKIDLITGSNMAGKSTFLRTIGINAVLALAGAPVCSTKMKISVINLFAYMRIRDSLNESISTFKAELNRLQLLLEILKTTEKVYFLVDEMLKGTNSVDKYRGSKAVIEKLVAQKAVGIVATHDLQLAELEQSYPDYIRNFYFDIRISGSEMLFDYKLKEGECKTFNASILLRQIGIDVEGVG